MTSPDHDRWLRVKERLRAEVGEDIFQSWFARMDLERVDGAVAFLSVPTRFLKSWIQSHYADRLLSCWQSEMNSVGKVELTVRTAVLKPLVSKVKLPEPDLALRDFREPRVNGANVHGSGAPISGTHEALGGSPLDPRLTFDTFVVGRSN